MIVGQDQTFFLSSGLREAEVSFRLNSFLWMIGNAVLICNSTILRTYSVRY